MMTDMKWWHQVFFPIRRAWLSLSSRLHKSRRNRKGGGLLNLREEVQTCRYEDVQVMWEMLRRSESDKVCPSRLVSDHIKS